MGDTFGTEKMVNDDPDSSPLQGYIFFVFIFPRALPVGYGRMPPWGGRARSDILLAADP
jgi:hypothetical protein